MLRAEMHARALRASQNVKESLCMGGRAMRLMSGRGVGECGSGRHSYGGGVDLRGACITKTSVVATLALRSKQRAAMQQKHNADEIDPA